MKKIGILTFHRVYNYGAVIQAYALQRFLFDNGYNNEIIDFSKKKQNDYTNVICFHNGFKRFLKSLLLFPIIKERIVRKRRFDSFFSQQLVLSKKLYSNEQDLMETNNLYSGYIVGSDQVWNVKKESDFSLAYFLDFADDSHKKISYASSIGICDFDDLKNVQSYIHRFDYVSCRENGGAKILSKLIERKVETVLDPTLIVSRDSLIELTSVTSDSPYILYYSLDGHDKKNNNMEILEYLCKRYSLELKIVMPEWPFHNQYGKDIRDAGPVEFLTLIRNASLVCTNSFHGTALALKFERPLYVLEEKNIKDERKRSILEQINATDRIVSCVDDLGKSSSYKMDYDMIKRKLNELEKNSRDYLLHALCW